MIFLVQKKKHNLTFVSCSRKLNGWSLNRTSIGSAFWFRVDKYLDQTGSKFANISHIEFRSNNQVIRYSGLFRVCLRQILLLQKFSKKYINDTISHSIDHLHISDLFLKLCIFTFSSELFPFNAGKRVMQSAYENSIFLPMICTKFQCYKQLVKNVYKL